MPEVDVADEDEGEVGRRHGGRIPPLPGAARAENVGGGVLVG
jgi:hypothetical protein